MHLLDDQMILRVITGLLETPVKDVLTPYGEGLSKRQGYFYLPESASVLHSGEIHIFNDFLTT